MNSKLIAGLLAGAMAMTAFAAIAAEPAKKPAASTAGLRTADGHSDFDGVWTNVSITPLERPAAYANEKFHTEAEVKKLEGAAVDRFVEGNAPTDPSSDALDHTKKNCQGAGGLDCGYNSGWKDSGTTLAQVDGKSLTSFVSSTPNGRIPAYKPGVRPPRRYSGGEGTAGGGPNDNPENRGLGERCLTSFGNSAGPVMLPLMYNNNYQFITTKDDVAIEVEMVHDVRHIRLNAKEHLPDNVRPWFGDSIGHWEGATLVSETTNFPDEQSFRGSDKNLKVIEKFTRTAPDKILYQFTVIDPTVWDQPWGGEYEFRKENGLLYEYACHEGNYAMEGILAGAREAERNEKQAAK
ncbi:MAG TPA: hypothetical protein VFN88_01570 [Caulobacteraceae bacterium]|nr:hypothetical protein [Caulobacteraceae bacterium]